MQRSLLRPLSIASAPIHPVAAQEDGSAADLGVMEINLKDAVQFNWGFQEALQGAGTPNQAGIGAFLPIAVGENSVWFIEALANAKFSVEMEKAASLIPISLVPPPAPQQGWVTAG